MGGTMPGSLKKTLETILVVDDNEEVLQIVGLILKDANFTCFQPETELRPSSWRKKRRED